MTGPTTARPKFPGIVHGTRPALDLKAGERWIRDALDEWEQKKRQERMRKAIQSGANVARVGAIAAPREPRTQSKSINVARVGAQGVQE